MATKKKAKRKKTKVKRKKKAGVKAKARRKPSTRRPAKKAKKRKSARKKAAKRRVAAKAKPARKRAAVKRKTTAARPRPARKPKPPVTPLSPLAPQVPLGEERIGIVTHYFSHLSVAVVRIESGRLRVGETIHIKGHTSDFYQTVGSMEIDHMPVPEVGIGQEFGLRVSEHAREHDVVYKKTP